MFLLQGYLAEHSEAASSGNTGGHEGFDLLSPVEKGGRAPKACKVVMLGVGPVRKLT